MCVRVKMNRLEELHNRLMISENEQKGDCWEEKNYGYNNLSVYH